MFPQSIHERRNKENTQWPLSQTEVSAICRKLLADPNKKVYESPNHQFSASRTVETKEPEKFWEKLVTPKPSPKKIEPLVVLGIPISRLKEVKAKLNEMGVESASIIFGKMVI
jgi:hypothetical protein